METIIFFKHSNQTNFIELESNISLKQLREFISNFCEINNFDLKISKKNGEVVIRNDEDLKALFEDVVTLIVDEKREMGKGQEQEKEQEMELEEKESKEDECVVKENVSVDKIDSEQEGNGEIDYQNIIHQAHCNNCKNIISGIRYKCINCCDFDLCSECEEKNIKENIHLKTHAFAKLYFPIKKEQRHNILPSFYEEEIDTDMVKMDSVTELRKCHSRARRRFWKERKQYMMYNKQQHNGYNNDDQMNSNYKKNPAKNNGSKINDPSFSLDSKKYNWYNRNHKCQYGSNYNHHDKRNIWHQRRRRDMIERINNYESRISLLEQNLRQLHNVPSDNNDKLQSLDPEKIEDICQKLSYKLQQLKSKRKRLEMLNN